MMWKRAATLIVILLGLTSSGLAASRPDYGGELEIAFSPRGLIGEHTTRQTLVLDLVSEPVWMDSRSIISSVDETQTPEGEDLTLRLREGIVFHDGMALTATILSDLLKDHLLPASHHYWLFRGVTEDTVAVSIEPVGKPESNDTVRLELGRVPALISAALELIRPVRGSFHSTILGTGPFEWSYSDPDTTRLEANEQHRCGRPFLDGITLIGCGSERQCESELLAGGVDGAWLRRGSLEPGVARSFRRLEEQESIWFIGMNSGSGNPRQHEFLTSPQQRSAFVRELRLDELTAALLTDQSPATQSLFISEVSVSATSEPTASLSDGSQERPVRVIFPEGVLEGSVIARRVQAVLLEFGFRPELTSLSESELQRRMELKQFDIVVAAVLPRASDARVNLASFYSNYVADGPFTLPHDVRPRAADLFHRLYFDGEMEHARRLEELVLKTSIIVPVVRSAYELWISNAYGLNESAAGDVSNLWLIENE